MEFEEKTWLDVPTLDGNHHVIPSSVFRQIVLGSILITELEDWEIVIRSIVDEWLNMIANKEAENGE